MNPLAIQFGKNLRRCRAHTDLSQEDLAFLASLHRTEIGLLETGARLPRIDTLMKLAAALVISPLELLDGIEWTPGSRQHGQFGVAPAGDAGASGGEDT